MRSPIAALALTVAAGTLATLAPAPPAGAGPLDGVGRFPPAGSHSVVSGSRYAIASESAYASAAAEAALRAGGTAVDAAVAAVLDIGVTKPESCGLGGGGFAVHHAPGGKVTSIDFRETAPSGAYGQDESMPDNLYVPGMRDARTNSGTGHAVVGVPGTLAGLVEMHRRWGTLNWPELFRSAIDDAERGFHAGPDLAGWVARRRQDFLAFPDTLKIFGPIVEGSLVLQPELAETLRRLADGEPLNEFYGTGLTAQLIEREMTETVKETAQYGDLSKWSDKDLESYEVQIRQPVRTRVRDETRGHGYDVYGMGPPSSGGIAVAQILGMLTNDDLTTMSPVDRVHLLAEVERLAFGDRKIWLGDPAFTTVPTNELVAREYLKQRRSMVSHAQVLPAYPAGEFDGYVQPPSPDPAPAGMHTTHISIATAAGEAVALTCTIEQALGSAVTARGTGILLNNELTDFDYAPGTPASAANAYAPGKRPRSSMSPTIVVRDGRPVLVIGGAGGTTIISGVAQALYGVLRAGLQVDAALEAGRTKAELSHAVRVEQVPTSQHEAFRAELEKRGHGPVDLLSGNAPPPVLSSVQLDASTGRLTAASDPRGEVGSRAG